MCFGSRSLRICLRAGVIEVVDGGSCSSAQVRWSGRMPLQRHALGDDRLELVVDDVDGVELAAQEVVDEPLAISRAVSSDSA